MDVHNRAPAFVRRHALLLGIMLVLAAGVMLFDLNWLRGPLVNYLEKKSGRHVRIDDLHLSIAWPFVPTLRLRGVNIENAPWASRQPMAVAGEVEFTFEMTSIWGERTIVTRMLLADADISMERKADGRRNWRLTEPDDRGPGKIRVLTLDAQRSKIHFINEGIDFEIVAQTTPVDVNARPSPVDEVLVNNLNVNGTYQGVRFNGSALIGNFMSFRESRQWFPLRGHLSAGKTRLDIDGRLADIFDLGPVDAQMRLAGDSFAHLHPFLKFKPPVSRPYALEAKV